MSNEKLDLNQIANENIKKKEGRKLNIKNIMKVFVTLFLLILFYLFYNNFDDLIIYCFRFIFEWIKSFTK